MHNLSSSQYMQSLRASIHDLQLLSVNNLDQRVPDCPGWTVRDLISHIGKVFAMVDAVVLPRSLVRVGPGSEAQAPDEDAVLPWFAQPLTRRHPLGYRTQEQPRRSGNLGSPSRYP